MKKNRKGVPINERSDNGNELFSVVYYEPNRISLLWSNSEDDMQNNEKEKMEINRVINQNEQKLKLIDVKGDTDKLDVPEIVELIKQELEVESSLEKELIYIQNRFLGFNLG